MQTTTGSIPIFLGCVPISVAILHFLFCNPIYSKVICYSPIYSNFLFCNLQDIPIHSNTKRNALGFQHLPSIGRFRPPTSCRLRLAEKTARGPKESVQGDPDFVGGALQTQ